MKQFEKIRKELITLIRRHHKSVFAISMGYQTRVNKQTSWQKIKGSSKTTTDVVMLYVSEIEHQTDETRKQVVQALHNYCNKTGIVVEWHMATVAWQPAIKGKR